MLWQILQQDLRWAQGEPAFRSKLLYFSFPETENNNMQITRFCLFHIICSGITDFNRCFVFTNTLIFFVIMSYAKINLVYFKIYSHLSFCSRMLLERLRNFGTSKGFRICITFKQEKLFFFVQITIYITYNIKLVMRSVIVHEQFLNTLIYTSSIFEKTATNLCLKNVNICFL